MFKDYLKQKQERLVFQILLKHAYDVIGRIQEVLSEVPLKGDLFPDIKNPLSSETITKRSRTS